MHDIFDVSLISNLFAVEPGYSPHEKTATGPDDPGEPPPPVPVEPDPQDEPGFEDPPPPWYQDDPPPVPTDAL
jgi:hypothetical protein